MSIEIAEFIFQQKINLKLNKGIRKKTIKNKEKRDITEHLKYSIKLKLNVDLIFPLNLFSRCLTLN